MLSICLAYALSVFDDDYFYNDLILFLLTIIYNGYAFIIFDYFGVLVDKKMTCRKSIKKHMLAYARHMLRCFFKEKKGLRPARHYPNCTECILWQVQFGCRLSKVVKNNQTTKQLVSFVNYR